MEAGYPNQPAKTTFFKWTHLMGLLQEYYQVTTELIEILETMQPDSRDEKIVLIEELLARRETLISTIVTPFTSGDKVLGFTLLSLEQKLMLLLTEQKKAIQHDIKQVKSKRVSNNKYVNPYEKIVTDGMFYDQRK
ncbi:flagellar protein FliT [Peribacillus sp. SCS-155]|uniref:flagellar protein FliT n=1 Tax=Peribacillus sedimenti TaxID=3115297 RepID=UPI003906845D